MAAPSELGLEEVSVVEAAAGHDVVLAVEKDGVAEPVFGRGPELALAVGLLVGVSVGLELAVLAASHLHPSCASAGWPAGLLSEPVSCHSY